MKEVFWAGEPRKDDIFFRFFTGYKLKNIECLQ